VTAALLILTTILGSWLIVEWRAIMKRSARWRLYAIRDELRWHVIKNPELRSRQAFRSMDNTISSFCGAPRHVSLWLMLLIPFAGGVDGSSRAFQNDMKRPENRWLLPYYKRSTSTITSYLMWRHCVALTFLAFTIVGFVMAVLVIREMSKRIASGSIRTSECCKVAVA
jgi:hypothetical protein